MLRRPRRLAPAWQGCSRWRAPSRPIVCLRPSACPYPRESAAAGAPSAARDLQCLEPIEINESGAWRWRGRDRLLRDFLILTGARQEVGDPIIDRTGLEGRFDIDLEFAPQAARERSPAASAFRTAWRSRRSSGSGSNGVKNRLMFWSSSTSRRLRATERQSSNATFPRRRRLQNRAGNSCQRVLCLTAFSSARARICPCAATTRVRRVVRRAEMRLPIGPPSLSWCDWIASECVTHSGEMCGVTIAHDAPASCHR